MRCFSVKLWLALGAPLVFTACATIAPPQPPSLQLPKPPNDLRAARKGDRVILTWTVPRSTTDRQTVRSLGPTRICRGPEPELLLCGTPVGEVSQASPTPAKSSGQKIAASYTGPLPQALLGDNSSSFITYAIEVLNAEGHGAGLSNQVHVSSARTLPPPQDFAARVTSQGVVLTWTSNIPLASTSTAHYLYRVYRRPEGSQQQILAGELPTADGRGFTITDSSIEWESTYEYHAETVTLVPQENKPELEVPGDDSPEIKVFAHDIFSPAVPSGLQAVASGPGQKTFVDLVWAPVTDVDLDGYNVYRHVDGMAPLKLNAAPLSAPAFRDTNIMPGNRYLYTVSAVDVRGNESGHSEEAGESVP